MTFPRARLQKGPVTFRTFESSNLCTRINIESGLGDDALGIIWGLGNNIINRCMHGFDQKLGFGVAQIQEKSSIMFSQYDPWGINLKTSKKQASIFTSQVYR